MPAREKQRLTDFEQQDAALSRNEESIIVVRRSFCFKCRYIYRPMQMIVGGLLLLLALLIFVSLLLSNINKCLHFISFKQIFAQGNQTLPNPIDLLLSWTGKVRDSTRRFGFLTIISSTTRSATFFSWVYWSTSSSHLCTVYSRSAFGIYGFEWVKQTRRVPCLRYISLSLC